jgi:hypothetical protein
MRWRRGLLGGGLVAGLLVPVVAPMDAADAAAPPTVVVKGRATVDGEPLDARFLGAIVLHDGLSTACQAAIPRVRDGRYRIPVFGHRGSAGCGTRGARVVLWTNVDDRQLNSTNTLRWPRHGRRARFAPRFSTSDPQGAAPATVGFIGDAHRRNGDVMPLGTKVEAFVGSTRCAQSSIRRADDWAGFIMSVAGPDTVPACAAGATLSFRIDGRPAAETIPNSPRGRDPVVLTVA